MEIRQIRSISSIYALFLRNRSEPGSADSYRPLADRNNTARLPFTRSRRRNKFAAFRITLLRDSAAWVSPHPPWIEPT